MTKLKEELAAPLRVMQEIARRIAKVSIESKLAVVEDEYVQSFKVELMDAVVQWCRGASFSDICKVCHICLDLIMHGSYSYSLAHRSIRGQSYPGFSKAWGTPSSNGRSRQGYW